MAQVYLQRKPVSQDWNVLIGISLLVGMLVIVFSIRTNALAPVEVFRFFGVYALVFVALLGFYWPLDRSLDVQSLWIGIGIAILIRILLLDVFPITSTDFHRNLMFGNIFALGIDPYITTGQQILSLLQNGDITLIIPYTNSWDTHAYDYPSIAIWFFWVVIQLSMLLSVDPFLLGKFFLNLFDVGSAYVIYQITKQYFNWHRIAALRASLIFLVNPFSVSQVGLEGQFESLPLLLFLLALYFFLRITEMPARDTLPNRANVYLGTFFLVLSILTKYYSVVCLPAIYLLIRDIRLIIRQILAMITFGFYLSIPFVISGPYVTNFLNFQFDRNANSLISTLPEIFGFFIELSFWAYLLCAVIMILAILKQDTRIFALGLMAFILTYVLFKNNSLFPWYFLWLLNVYPVIRIADSYIEVLLWFLLVFIYLVIWITDVSFLLVALVILVSGFLLSFSPGKSI